MEKIPDSSKLDTVIDQTQKIKFGEKLAFGLGSAAGSVVWASVSTFLLFFFTDIARIPLVAAGVILMAARIFDGFVDVGVGLLVDRTNTRFGKARPWILWMVVPFSVLTVMLFTVPNFGTGGKIAYAAVVYILINIVYSSMVVPYTTLNSMMTQDQYQRSVLNIFNVLMASGATLIISSCTLGFINVLGGGASGWHNVFIVYAVIAMILYLTTFAFTKERVKPADVKKENQKVPVGAAMKALFQNKYLWLLVVVFIIGNISINIIQSVSIYYAKYVLGDENMLSILMVALLLSLLIGLIFVAPFIKKFGKRNCALVGSIVVIVTSV
ncbi:MAG: MFS transporter, partial [Acetanaerobacterium sp.]